MAKQFLDASGLNQYTQALKNGTLIVGRAQDASFSDDASTAFYASHAAATGLIGVVPLANLPTGALERLVTVANDTARFALTEDDVQLGDTVKVTSTGMMYLVVDVSKLSTEAGYVEYTAGRAAFAQDASHADVATKAVDASNAVNAQHAVTAQDASSADSVEWDNVQNKPTEFTPAKHTQDASTINMTNYAKASTYSAVAASDNALVAIGKVEKKALDASNTADWDHITNKPGEFPVEAHTHGAVDVSTLTGYEKAAANAAVAEGDSLLVALGKLEKKADDAQATANLHTQDASTITKMTGYTIAGSYTAVSANDSLETAIGKIEKQAVDSSNTADWDSITNVPSEFTPAAHDAAKVTSLATYSRTGISGDVSTGDSLVVAIAKVENAAKSGADDPIPSDIITAIVNGEFGN